MADRPSADITIQDSVEVGGTPGTAGVSPEKGTAPQTLKLQALAGREYAASGRLSWYINAPKALSWAIDDITTDFGDDLYSRMLLDAQVRSVVDVYKASVLEEGVNLQPAIDDKEEEGYQEAADLVDRAEAMFDDLAQSMDDVLWDMLDAIALGNRLAEQRYELDRTSSGKQEYVLQALTVKPRESVAFVVDAYLQVLGILGRIPGQPFNVQQGQLLSDIEHTANLLPRSKFAVLTFRPRNNDPRGTSVLRAAYTPWNAKMQLLKEHLKFLAQFAVPSMVGYTAEEAGPYQLMNADGTPRVDAYGNPVMQTPEEDMVAALQAFANGTATAFPYGSKVQPIEMTGDGNAFLQAFQNYDRQITKAVLLQTLATEEGLHQTRAASSTHKDILDTIIRQSKRPVERMLQRDVLGTWLRLNGQEALLPLLPIVTLGTAEQEDLPKLWTAFAALQASGYTDASQYPETDAMLGLPERDPQSLQPADGTGQVSGGQEPATVDPNANPAQQNGAQAGQPAQFSEDEPANLIAAIMRQS